jgi:hypothetical protein
MEIFFACNFKMAEKFNMKDDIFQKISIYYDYTTAE